MKRPNPRGCLLVLLVLLGATSAIAEPVTEPPAPRPLPGLTLPQGAVAITLVAELNASSGSLGEPTSIAPDVGFGVTPDLTLSVIHSTFGITGFRGAAGRGVCFTGRDHGCPHIYDSAGVEALYGLRRGPLAVAANAGAYGLSYDAGHHGLKLGFKIRYSVDRITLTAMPSVFVAITERDSATAPNRDILWLPTSVAYKLASRFSLAIAAGLKGPFQGFGERFEVAVGVSAQYTLTRASTIGASWAHGKLVGGDVVIPSGTSGLDFRAIHLWFTTTM